ncbi:undecaprenyl-diphosphate phosphatase [Synechococcus sp. A10-1-5-1]|uniref:undecaprenyl-diphosphate phosphatase n=1 Tax=Synechococcus sp. A10-1-5-1 TaxID=2936507 RepID=UPI002000BD36|nr:undecaprenyl-diphosphate phosphatase [Synechococcus sp. A10-1-5-1]UPM49704.1 undecaprenyl-diphosphate phosphatase [Synechococcus sp. A10-1-5-1]
MTTLTPTESLGVLEACWRFLVLGVVQGLTEFLPISSTAHLKVVPVLLGWGDPGVAVTAVIQLGSIAAVIGFFREDLRQVIKASWQAWLSQRWDTPEARLGQAILWGTLPILVAGLGIKVFVSDFDQSPLRSLTSIGIVSIVMGLLLGLAERCGSRRRVLSDVVVRDGWLVGLAQTLALIPGVSRSGSTLTAALFDGWKRSEAARFSFLLGIPAISLAGLVELKDAFSEPAAGGALPLLVGIGSSAVVSWLAIAWLLRFLQNHSTWWFVGYRVFFGLGVILWAARSVA